MSQSPIVIQNTTMSYNNGIKPSKSCQYDRTIVRQHLRTLLFAMKLKDKIMYSGF